MSWARLYHVALYLLPAALRRKHGPAMEGLFARDLEQASVRGRRHGALAGMAGLWDVVRRGGYEQLRRGGAALVSCNHYARRYWSMEARAGQHPGGPLVPRPSAPRLLLRHARSFAFAVVMLTGSFLALFAKRQIPLLSARGVPAGTIAQTLLFALPFMAALTIPMAVFVAVLHEFIRLRLDGTLAGARRQRDGVRRLVAPVLGAAVGVSVLAFVVTAEIVPRANERLAAVLYGSSAASSARTMTIGELQQAARSVRPGAEPLDLERVALYEVEVQKKFALPAACIVMALLGVAIALGVPKGGTGLMIGASVVVFGAYYLLFITGESLATRLVISPFLGMWGADALLLAIALLAVWMSPRASSDGEPIIIRG